MKNKREENIWKRLTKNWGLKIGSILFAIALWLVVVNVNDPTIKVTFANIPVTIENVDVITSQGMIYEVLNETDVVPRVSVYAPKSIAQNIDKNDIVAVADMNNLNSLNAISIDYSVSRYGSRISDISGSIDAVKVNIENRKTIQKVLETNVIGDAPAGYMVGNVTTDQNLVRVSGPESVVNRVESAVVSVDMSTLSGFTNDITTSVPVIFYDADGNVVTGNTLEKRPENVMITIEILSTKEVPITFDTAMAPADGYGLNGVILGTPQTVTLAGRKSVLNAVEEIKVPAEALDVTNATADTALMVNVANYLPEGTAFADKTFNGYISVVVGVEKEITEEFEMTDRKVSLINVPDDYTYELEGLDEEFMISVTGIGSVVRDISEKSLTAYFDVNAWLEKGEITELLPGRYPIELIVNLPEYSRMHTPLLATLVVTEIQTEEDAEQND